MDKLRPYLSNFLVYAAKATFTFILVIVLVTVAIVQMFSRTEDIAELRYFSVEGKSTREVVPDEIYVTVGTLVDGDDIVSIQNEANTKVDNAVKAIEKLGIPKENIKTSTYNLDPKYNYQSGKIRGYTINVELRVKIENVTTEKNQAGDVIEASAVSGLNEVRGLNYSISNRDELIDELKIEAIEDAKSRKDDLAKASGLTLGDIEDVEFGYYDPYYYDDIAEYEKGAAPRDTADVENVEINPGQTELSATVTLVYKIL